MQTQDNTVMCYRKGNRRTWRKTSPPPSKRSIDPLENKLEYMNNKKPSKPSLPNVLEPSKLLLPTGFSEPCLLGTLSSLAFSNPAIQPDCIRQVNGSFQCFLAAPKPHFTLKLGVVSVWAINLSRIWIWRGRSRGKPQGNV